MNTFIVTENLITDALKGHLKSKYHVREGRRVYNNDWGASQGDGYEEAIKVIKEFFKSLPTNESTAYFKVDGKEKAFGYFLNEEGDYTIYFGVDTDIVSFCKSKKLAKETINNLNKILDKFYKRPINPVNEEMLNAIKGAIAIKDLWSADQHGTVGAHPEGEMQALKEMENKFMEIITNVKHTKS